LYMGWSAMFAGDITAAIDVIRAITERLGSWNESHKNKTLNEVMLASSVAYKERLRKEAEDQVLSCYGLSMSDFLAHGRDNFGDEQFRYLCGKIESVAIDLDLLIYGFDECRRPNIFTLSCPGTTKNFEEIGFWAIGVGQKSALSSLMFQPQNLNTPLGLTIYHVLEAKFMAESAYTIGKETFLCVYDRDWKRRYLKPGQLAMIRKRWHEEGKPRTPSGIADQISSGLVTADLARSASQA
jgi:hypothetical protein